MKKLLVAASLLLAAPAFAQTVQQSGTVTRGHIPYWVTSGVIGDGGSSADSPISSIGVTNNGGAGFCVSSDRQTAAGRNQLCFGASTAGPATISLQNYGTATSQSIQFNLNGTLQGFPTVTPLPVTIGDFPCFNNTAGALTDCGYGPAGVPYTPPYSGGVTETQTAYNAQRISVKDFGAKCDGTTDDTAAINAALATGLKVELPTATCKVAGTLHINVSGTSLVGTGMKSSVLTASTANLPLINVGALVFNITISNFELTRSAVAVSGGYGITFSGLTEEARISNMWIEKQNIGIVLQTTSESFINDLIITDNTSHGILANNQEGIGGLQWVIDNVLSQQNGGSGFVWAGVGTAGITLGTWTRLATFANAAFGISVLGTATAPINGVRLYNSFLGGDVAGEFDLDSHGGLHQLASNFFELSGGSTPCIAVTANNRDVTLTGNMFSGCGGAGINSAATEMLNVTGGEFRANGGFGIVNSGNANVVGARFFINSSGDISNAGTLTAYGNVPASNDTAATVVQGGTGRSTLTNHGVLVGAGTAAITQLGVGTNGQLLIGSSAADPAFTSMSQDCTITSGGVITCLKTNNVSFGTAATQNTGTSGATVPLLNAANTWSANQTYALGGTSSALLTATSNYNVVSLNNTGVLASALGVFGGATGDANTLYLDAPSAVSLFTATQFVPSAANTNSLGTSTSPWLNVFADTYISKGTAPTGTTGSCSASAFTGGSTAGKFTAPTCAAGTIILSALPTAPNGYTCNAQDQTTITNTLKQSANTTTSATFTSTTTNNDVVVFNCMGW